MSISRHDRPALILIDIQKGFDNLEYWGGQRNNPDAENNAGELRSEEAYAFSIFLGLDWLGLGRIGLD